MNATPCNSGGTVTLNAEGGGKGGPVGFIGGNVSSGALVTLK